MNPSPATAHDHIPQLVEQILDQVHPLMAEGFYLAAVPLWYNLPLFAAIRSRDDGRDPGIVERLNRFSFISPLQNGKLDETAYVVAPGERLILQKLWIARDQQAYLAAHRRALAYWEAFPHDDPFVQARNKLYHLLLVDYDAGVDYLAGLYRTYEGDRQLSAIDLLLATAGEARSSLALLPDQPLAQFDDLLAFLEIRLAQLRGHWAESKPALQELLSKPDLPERLVPYVGRALGHALAQEADFVEALRSYQQALKQFDRQAASGIDSQNLPTERALTLIALGDAHVDLALSARGHQEREQHGEGILARLRGFSNFFLSLPLVVYLSRHLGRRVWLPSFWPALPGLDWIIARLFAIGADYYGQAHALLERSGQPGTDFIADEKLAFLFLRLGDADQAQALFSHLLTQEQVSLGEYRQASARLGLAQALFWQGQVAETRQQLMAALPVLRYYEDTRLEAEAQALLAEVLLLAGDPGQAIYRSRQAMVLYQRSTSAEEASVTGLAEGLTELAQDERASAEQQELARQTANAVAEYHYPVRYRHQATVLFQRTILGLLAIVIFLMPVVAIRLESGASIVPQIEFQATPLLQSTNPNFNPKLGQGVVGLDVDLTPDGNVLLWLAALLFLTYLLLSTGLGWLAIVRTSLGRLQATTRAERILLDHHGLQGGESDGQEPIELAQVTQFVRADVQFGDQLMIDNTAAALITPTRRITIRGTTAWYPALLRRIDSLLPATANRTNLGYSILRSRMGGVYLLTIGLLTLLSLLGKLAATRPLVTGTLPGMPYSLADLYPYLYLGLFLPPVWWFVVKPLRLRRHLSPQDNWPWLLGGLGLLLALIRLLTRFRPWLTVPDIYPSLAISLLVGSAGVMIWLMRRPGSHQPLYPLWMRGMTLVLLTAILAVMGSHLWRETRAYHFLIAGNTLRDQALHQVDREAQQALAERAVTAYSQAVEIAEGEILGIGGQATAAVPGGIPPVHQFTWFSARHSRAAMQALQSQPEAYQEAIDDYTTLLPFSQEPDEIRASRAMAYQGLGTVEPATDVLSTTLEIERVPYLQAINDFDAAITANPNRADYYLWRGVAHHALDHVLPARQDYEKALGLEGEGALLEPARAQAYTGLGWLDFAEGASKGLEDPARRELLEQAVQSFAQGAEADSRSAEPLLGLGYAYYSLRQYDQALQAWTEAAELDPNDPLILISLGTLYWRVGTLGEDLNATGGRDRCDNPQIPESDKRRSAEQLQQSVDYFADSLKLPGQEAPELAFTARTRAQVLWLLRMCPGYDTTAVLEQSIDSYSQAIGWDEGNAGYWQMRGRITYVLWRTLQQESAGADPTAGSWLLRGLDDLDHAIGLKAEDKGGYFPNEFKRDYYLPGSLQAARDSLVLGQVDQAAELYARGLQIAREQDGEMDYLSQALLDLEDLAAKGGGVDAGSVRAQLQAALAEARARDPASLFADGLAAWQADQRQEATNLYAKGLELAVTKPNIPAAATALVALRAQVPLPESSDLIRRFQEALPQLEKAAGPTPPIAAAVKLGLMAMALEDYPRAAQWYHRAIPQRGVDGTTFGQLRAAREDLRGLWQVTGVTSSPLLKAMDAQIAEQLQAEPELAQKGFYWRYRAWFKFHLGVSAFGLGDEQAAAELLESAKSDGAMAYEISADHKLVGFYPAEAGWGWYHYERAQERRQLAEQQEAEGDLTRAQATYTAALSDYESAFRFIEPQEEMVDAPGDKASAAFWAGLMALRLGEPGRAASGYDQGMAVVSQYPGNSWVNTVLTQAIANLEEYLTLIEGSPDHATGLAILEDLKALGES